jgi:hypothetical protein
MCNRVGRAHRQDVSGALFSHAALQHRLVYLLYIPVDLVNALLQRVFNVVVRERQTVLTVFEILSSDIKVPASIIQCS